MKVEVEVISNEIVKPSSPTPDHLRHYQLSFLDQSSPRFYSPFIFYYALKDHNTISSEVNIPNLLKKSLSNVLTLYYPLAGRLRNEGFLVCNDEGIPFLEARVKGQLSEVLNNPIASELNKFLPFELHEHNEVVLGVQLNVFDCGGIVIGACISDKLADALSCFRFLRTWAAIARRDDADVVSPEFVSAARFPPRTEPMIDSEACIMKKGIISKRFVFDTFAIEALREKYERKENNIRPSRVETLSAFILSRFEAATNEVESVAALEKFYTVLHTVHLRPRLDPPLFENAFGNYFKFAATLVPASTIKGEASITNGLVKNIREGIRKVDKEHLKKLQMGEEDEHLSLIKERSTTIKERGGEVIVFEFTSLCRFPIYEADFGWGKPDWVSSASMNFDKLVAFLDNKTGDAIEAYVSLKEEHMAKLEADKEFLNYVSF